MAKVTFEFDIFDDAEQLRMYQNIDKMYFALDEIYQMTRAELKHGDEELSDYIERLLERIKEEAGTIHEIAC